MEVRISGNRVGPQIIYPGSPNDLARILKSFGEGSPNSLGRVPNETRTNPAYYPPDLPFGESFVDPVMQLASWADRTDSLRSKDNNKDKDNSPGGFTPCTPIQGDQPPVNPLPVQGAGD
jgi:hypothetical protein